jgi:Putative 2OG-Fe(II) oxygenase
MAETAEQIDSADGNFKFVEPFSPSLLMAKIPMPFVDSINNYLDNISQTKRERLDYSAKLAGVLELETSLSEFLDEESAFKKFLIGAARTYLSQAANAHLNQSLAGDKAATVRIEIQDIWANDMVAGDFSPAHFHTNCQLSCVGFLRNPIGYEEERAACAPHKSATGCLQLIDGRTVFGGVNMVAVVPEVSKFVMFPAWMLHCVYPFRSAGIRRTFSANFRIVYVRD